MKKKTSKQIKGGKSFLENIVGSINGQFVSDNIQQNVILGKKEDLINEYKIKKELAEKEFTDINQQYEAREKIIQEEKRRNLNQDNLNFKKRQALYNNVSSLIKACLVFLGNIFLFIYKLITNVLSGSLNVITLIINFIKSPSPILKLIVLIIVILIIVGIALGITMGTSQNKNFDYKNQTSLDIFTQTKVPSIGSYVSSSFMNMMPEQYRLKLTSIKNDFNKMIGNDIIGNSIDNQLRETTNTGSWNNIHNLNIDNKIKSAFKPNDIEYNINIDDYPNSDYFKLPYDVRTKIYNSSNNIIIIPIKMNKDETKYYYDFNNAYYKDAINTENKANIVKNPPFINTDRKDYFKTKDLPLEDYVFTDGDNINPDVLKDKMIEYDARDNNILLYPMKYINNKIL